MNVNGIKFHSPSLNSPVSKRLLVCLEQQINHVTNSSSPSLAPPLNYVNLPYLPKVSPSRASKCTLNTKPESKTDYYHIQLSLESEFVTSVLPSFHLYLNTTHITTLGAGSYPGGKYSMVCFETPGTAQFMPNEGAKPNIGKLGELERVEEVRVEVLCVGREVMVGAVDSLKHAHPYEEPAYEVIKLEDV